MRQEGYYWVRYGECDWSVAHYMNHKDSDVHQWQIHDYLGTVPETDMVEIDERRIDRLPSYLTIDISKYSEKEIKIIIDNIVDHKGPIVLKNLEKLKNP